MTASRSCRACGAELRGDVMWCLRCYEPMRHLAPREAQLPTIHFLGDRDAPEMSRWKPGINTFGPLGRLVVTVLVLAMAPWSTNLVAIAVAWPAYLVVAGIVLHGTWKKDYVQTTTIAEMAAGGNGAEARGELARTPIPRSTLIAWGALAALVVGLGVVWVSSGDVGHGIVMISASVAALVLAVRWLAVR